MIDFLEKAGYIVVSWTTLSLVGAVVWSRFMSRLHRAEARFIIAERRVTPGRAEPLRARMLQLGLTG